MRLQSLLLLSLTALSLAEVGDKCGWGEKKGTCKKSSSCTSIGFTFDDACPNDPENIKCCVVTPCTKQQKAPLIALGGKCFDKRKNPCKGGRFERNLCPGDNNVQCCIKDPVSAPRPVPRPPTPSPPKCEAAKYLNGPTNILFSRQGTKLAASYYTKAGDLLDYCNKLFGKAFKVIGLPCTITKVVAENIARHATGCDKKNQCLRVAGFSVPYCVGANDGCCSEGPIWVNP